MNASHPPTPGRPIAPTGGARSAAWVVAFTLTLPLLFAVVTGQVWEDFLITFRFSRNAADGLGLVYQAGERVHGFTSPLNVLLPALWQKVFHPADFHPALWFFIACGLAVAVFGLIRLCAGIRDSIPMPAWVAAAPALLCFVQVKASAFSVNGQEAAFTIGFLALALAAAIRGVAAAPVAAGIAWAGLLWTRPDAPIYIAALGLAGLGFAGETVKAEWRGMVKAALVAAGLYAPWLLWAWWYYGSPVPHTAIAKVGVLGEMAGGAVGWGELVRTFPVALRRGFEPIYAEAGGWPVWVSWYSLGCGIFCASFWVLPVRDRIARMASLGFLVIACYLAWMGTTGIVYPWYFPPLCLLGAVVMSRGLWLLAIRWSAVAATAGALGVLLPALWLFSASLYQVRVQQTTIEDGTRAEVGRWLKTHVADSETVFLEPLGYIGYFSGKHMLDYPGLVTPAVVAARHAGARGFGAVAARLRPDWIVIRGRELPRLQANPELAANYEVATEFDAIPRLERMEIPRGTGYLLMDSRFLVLHQKASK